MPNVFVLFVILCTDSESEHHSLSGLFVPGAGIERHIRINGTPIRGGGSRSFDDDSSRTQSFVHLGEKNDVVNSDNNPLRKLLMFHGIILRSQLTVLLKHKVFFDENDKVNMLAI